MSVLMQVLFAVFAFSPFILGLLAYRLDGSCIINSRRLAGFLAFLAIYIPCWVFYAAVLFAVTGNEVFFQEIWRWIISGPVWFGMLVIFLGYLLSMKNDVSSNTWWIRVLNAAWNSLIVLLMAVFIYGVIFAVTALGSHSLG